MSACTLPTVSYREFSERVHRRDPGSPHERVPISGSVELTYRCNLRCVHCYIPHRSRQGELDTDGWRRVLDEAAEAGCFYLLISGGEPFLRDDALEIYLHAKRLGMLVSIFTNGTLITPEIAGTLAEYPPFNVEITLYGATGKTYRSVTGSAKAYHEALRGIELLREAGVPLALKSMVLRQNRDDLPAMREQAARLGLDYRYDAAIHPRGDGDCTPVESRLAPADVVGLDRLEPKRYDQMAELHERFRGAPGAERLFLCGAGRSTFHVDPFGRYMMCESLHAFQVDSRTSSFREFWERELPKILERSPARVSRCQRCTLQALCEQCPAWSHMETGHLEDPVDYLCQITAGRAEAMDLPDRPPAEEIRS